ncbi:hypothetical protein EDD85DRAFT_447404 [Armillaria nabsnona]|nr:hypothetical protein EDD85DRAFT_447404 [Armillaria nabsnona]
MPLARRAASRTPGIAHHRLSSNSILDMDDLRADISLQSTTTQFMDTKSRAGKLLYMKTTKPGKPLSTNHFVNIRLRCDPAEQSVLSVVFRRCSVVFPDYLARFPEDDHFPVVHWIQYYRDHQYLQEDRSVHPVVAVFRFENCVRVVVLQDDIMTTLIPVRFRWIVLVGLLAAITIIRWSLSWATFRAIITIKSLSVVTRRRAISAELSIPLASA